MPKQAKNSNLTPAGEATGYAQFVEGILTRFPERSQTILLERFGITGEAEKTLEEIGKRYGITRERVRQVVGSVLKNMKRTITEKSDLPLIVAIRDVIETHAGIATKETLLNTLAGESQRERGALTVILLSLPFIKILKETKEYRECYVLETFSMTEWEKVLDATSQLLTEKNDVLDLATLFREVKTAFGDSTLTVEKLAAYIEPSQIVEKNVFDRYGLSHWNTIRPRGTRERAYLILKMLGKPLHFREIAKLIDEYGLYRRGKKTHPQTVHNELIKDTRFVLVGRGTYALASWGYKRGTVREVLADILKQGKEPMTRDALLQAVMKVRQVKKSTVIINLNSFFTKVGKNVYTVKGK